MDNRIYMQITSGRGPAECCRVVALVLEKIMAQAKSRKLFAEVLEREQGATNHTLFSATLIIEGEGCEILAKEWQGTIQWIARSPYRIHHKRKNWYVGVNVFEVPDANTVNEKEFSYQTLRSSGPGGQHVNKTESAVRATHLPSGLSATASDERSQFQNKKLATERLLIKLAARDAERITEAVQENWNNHNSLQRGNPVKTFQEPLD